MLPAHRRAATPEESIALAATAEPLFAPGAQWSYSNTNYIMLGLIAEAVTGATWEDQIRARFSAPLSLTDTYVWEGTARPPTVAGSRMRCGEPGEPATTPRNAIAVVTGGVVG